MHYTIALYGINFNDNMQYSESIIKSDIHCLKGLNNNINNFYHWILTNIHTVNLLVVNGSVKKINI